MCIVRLSQSDFHHVLERTSGPALVYFSAPACGACRQLNRVLEALCRQHSAISVFRVDAEQEPGLVREFEVFHLPAMFLYLDGRYHRPVDAVPEVSAIVAAIDELARKPALEAP